MSEIPDMITQITAAISTHEGVGKLDTVTVSRPVWDALEAAGEIETLPATRYLPSRKVLRRLGKGWGTAVKVETAHTANGLFDGPDVVVFRYDLPTEKRDKAPFGVWVFGETRIGHLIPRNLTAEQGETFATLRADGASSFTQAVDLARMLHPSEVAA